MIRTWVPLLLLALAFPLILGIVPRNYIYGFRTQRTLASDAIWYPVNRVSGVLLAVVSLVWWSAGITVGLVALGVAGVASTVYTGLLVARQEPS